MEEMIVNGEFLETQGTEMLANGMSAFSGGMLAGLWIIWITLMVVIGIFQFVSYGMTLNKAKLPRWSMFIPFYHIYIHLKLAGRTTRWALFPPVLLVLLIITNFDIAKKFGYPAVFGLGLWFFPPIFYGILAFSKEAIYNEAA